MAKGSKGSNASPITHGLKSMKYDYVIKIQCIKSTRLGVSVTLEQAEKILFYRGGWRGCVRGRA